MTTAESRREARRRWKEKNPHYYRDWIRRKRQDPAIKKRDSEAARAWQRANPIKWALQQYKRSAQRKGHVYELADDALISLITSECYYCGAAPDPVNGVDRVDNAQGYIDLNVVASCGQCNYAKRTLTVEQFEAWALRLAQRISERSR